MGLRRFTLTLPSNTTVLANPVQCWTGQCKNVNIFSALANAHLFRLVGCRVYGRLSHEGPKPMGGMPSMGIFLRDSSPYLRENDSGVVLLNL